MLRLLVLCSLLFPPNHHGLSFKISQQKEKIFQLGMIPDNTQSRILPLEISAELYTKSNPTQEMTWLVIVTVLLILVVSPYLGILGTLSLQDQGCTLSSIRF